MELCRSGIYIKTLVNQYLRNDKLKIYNSLNFHIYDTDKEIILFQVSLSCGYIVKNFELVKLDWWGWT